MRQMTVITALALTVVGILLIAPTVHAGCCGGAAYGSFGKGCCAGATLNRGPAPAASCCPPVPGASGPAPQAAPNVQRPSSALPPCCQGANATASPTGYRASGPVRVPQLRIEYALPEVQAAGFSRPAGSSAGSQQTLPPCCQPSAAPKRGATQPAAAVLPESPVLSAILAGPKTR